jgi:UDP-N-acetylmuramoyl-L-alanyl-D-glutamate--2,6-diaminopimelate ligase
LTFVPSSSLRPQRPVGVTLARVAELAEAQCPRGHEQLRVAGATLDSRQVVPGDLYAALPGQRAHGASFVEEAIAAGAVAVLTDEAGARDHLADSSVPVLVVPTPRAVLGRVAAAVYGDPADSLQMIGITGTNGKTTTAYLVESALRAAGRTTGLIGTVETRVGQTRLKSVRTTPESTDLMAILAMMCEAGVTTVVMEVSSHALAQRRVDGVRYDVAAFTNLSQDHLDYHGDMERYFAAKADLFTPARSARGVVCVDDEWGRLLRDVSTVPIETLRSNAPGDTSRPGPGEWLVVPGEWPTFRLLGAGVTLNLRSALPGAFNVTNTGLAAVILLAAGLTAEEVTAGLLADPHVPGRMQRADSGSGDQPRVIVDYAHTPDAVHAAVDAVRGSTPGRLVVVLGAGGDRDRAKRAAMGAAAAAADIVVVTDDNPRSEDPATIRSAVRDGAASAGARLVHDVGARGQAIALAVHLARPDDTVLVLGKGHESGQEVAGVVHAFDDMAACRAALERKPYMPEDPA